MILAHAAFAGVVREITHGCALIEGGDGIRA